MSKRKSSINLFQQKQSCVPVKSDMSYWSLRTEKNIIKEICLHSISGTLFTLRLLSVVSTVNTAPPDLQVCCLDLLDFERVHNWV